MTESTKARTAGPPIPESQSPDRDYPQMVGERGLIEPAPRRVRGYSDGTLVFDTTRAHYVWEIAYYPQYYVPSATSARNICRTRTTSRNSSSAPRGCFP